MRLAPPQDPYRAMLRGGALPTLVVALAALVGCVVHDGGPGAAGSVLATAVVCASFGSSLAIMSRTAKQAPHLVMVVALATYVTKVGLLGLFLLVFGGAHWLSGPSFSLTALCDAAAWLAGELWAFTRVRTLVFDDPAPASKVTPS